MTMSSSIRAQTISAKSHNIRRRFLDLITLTNEKCTSDSLSLLPSAIVDSLERFSLWAGNMGAMDSSLAPLSLDQRVVEAVDIRGEIHRQLDEIIEAIGDR